MDHHADIPLVGRAAEVRHLEQIVARTHEARSAAVVVSGPAGIGKTALVDHVAGAAARSGVQMLATRGYEGEADLPYASLFDLLRPVIDRREQLPAVQARALGVALALEDPAPLDPFAVPAAILGILAAAATDGPLLAVVDDLQWVDAASREALLFAARRLRDEGVAMILTLRDEGSPAAQIAGLERVELGGLPAADAVELLRHADRRIPRVVASELAARAGGNPLALLELPAALSDAQRSGGEPLDGPLPLGDTLERAFARRLSDLPDTTRRALVAAALAETPDLPTVHRALEHLELPSDALGAAELRGLVAVRDDGVRFRHPLVRSSVQRLAPEPDRRAAHAALAAAVGDPHRRAWHRALATVHPDEGTAGDLAAVGAQARDRGAHVAAARALARAATLTPDPGTAAQRRFAAAAAWLDGGHPEQARQALDEVDTAAPGAPSPFDASRVRAQLELRSGQPVQAHARLVDEARRLEAEDALVPAAQAMLEAAVAHMMTGGFDRLVADAERSRDLAAAAGEEGEAVCAIVDVLLGETFLAMGETARGDALLDRREAFLLAVDPLAAGTEIVGMAGHSSFWIERWERAAAILDHLVDAAREASAFGKLVYPLAARAQMHFRRGRWVAALADANEAVELARATGQAAIQTHALSVLAEIEAGLGRTDDAQRHGREALDGATTLGLVAITAYALRALGLDHLGQRRVREALTVLARVTEVGEELRLGTAGLVMYLPDHVEALVLEGRPDEAVEVLAALERRAGTGGTWGPAAVERCRGLLADGDDYEEHFEAALRLHEQGAQPFEHARTALAYGERLRRSRRRGRAREPLQLAHDLFRQLGAEPWLRRTEAELAATGAAAVDAPVSRSVTDELTPGELQIALMVARGLRNREVAASLFLSERTVENHLTSIYRKLDVRTRAGLASRIGREDDAGSAVATPRR